MNAISGTLILPVLLCLREPENCAWHKAGTLYKSAQVDCQFIVYFLL